jgi:NAD(P)-dependent dehydrogenase (short-subunit alcohol dehydrogenase family)
MTEILIRKHYDDRDAALEMFHSRQPTGSMGDPGDVAAAAVYLASDEAKFVTGSLLTVDGAWTAG